MLRTAFFLRPPWSNQMQLPLQFAADACPLVGWIGGTSIRWVPLRRSNRHSRCRPISGAIPVSRRGISSASSKEMHARCRRTLNLVPRGVPRAGTRHSGAEGTWLARLRPPAAVGRMLILSSPPAAASSSQELSYASGVTCASVRPLRRVESAPGSRWPNVFRRFDRRTPPPWSSRLAGPPAGTT